jgi:hypothetical protein
MVINALNSGAKTFMADLEGRSLLFMFDLMADNQTPPLQLGQMSCTVRRIFMMPSGES